jgi:hypothetical protein
MCEIKYIQNKANNLFQHFNKKYKIREISYKYSAGITASFYTGTKSGTRI